MKSNMHPIGGGGGEAGGGEDGGGKGGGGEGGGRAVAAREAAARVVVARAVVVTVVVLMVAGAKPATATLPASYNAGLFRRPPRSPRQCMPARPARTLVAACFRGL